MATAPMTTADTFLLARYGVAVRAFDPAKGAAFLLSLSTSILVNQARVNKFACEFAVICPERNKLKMSKI